jgi:hypothetical protein
MMIHHRVTQNEFHLKQLLPLNAVSKVLYSFFATHVIFAINVEELELFSRT